MFQGPRADGWIDTQNHGHGNSRREKTCEHARGPCNREKIFMCMCVCAVESWVRSASDIRMQQVPDSCGGRR